MRHTTFRPHSLSVLHQLRKPTQYQLLLRGDQLPDSLPSSESIVLSDVSWTPRLNSRSVFLAGDSLSPFRKKNEKSSVSGLLLFISCGMGFRGDLRLFTQVLVEFWLQETRVRVVFHQAVHPFLGSCEAATGSFLYVLGNQSFGLKVYVDLFWSFFFYEVSIYFLCFWGQLLGWLGFFEVFRGQPEFNIFFTVFRFLKSPECSKTIFTG